MTNAIRPEDIRAIGEFLYGRYWPQPMARLLSTYPHRLRYLSYPDKAHTQRSLSQEETQMIISLAAIRMLEVFLPLVEGITVKDLYGKAGIEMRPESALDTRYWSKETDARIKIKAAELLSQSGFPARSLDMR